MRRDDPPGLIFPSTEADDAESVESEKADVTSEAPDAVMTEDSVQTSEITAPIQESAESIDVLYTSHDPLHHFRLTFEPDAILLDGVYEGQEVTRIELESTGSVRPQYSGDILTAKFDIGQHSDSDRLFISFKHGGSIPVYIEYDAQGEPQPLITNALEHSIAALAHPITIPRSAVMEYIMVDSGAEERAAVLEHIRGISDRVCTGLDNDYDKARALAAWVSKNIYYDYVAYNSEVNVETLSLARTIELQRSVCGGYANLYAALCQAQGLVCHVVKGTVIQGGGTFEEGGHAAPSHEWNVLELDGRHVWVDTLWNTDNAYNGEYCYGDQKYRYFDISDECMAINHRAERVEIRKFY